LKFRTICVLAVLLVAGAAAAETVMISIEDETGIVDEDYIAASRYHLTAVEDGVMESFFDAGHIVFNFGAYEQSGESDIQRRYSVRTAAEDGGASYVVQLSLEFARLEDNRLRPLRVDYELWEVGSGQPVVEGSRSAPFNFPAELRKPGSRSAELGRRVARELLSAW
jgi:hypothetical protein